VLDAFEDRIIAVTAPRAEVSVVKFLGDAAMLVAADPVTLAEAMVELTTSVPALEDVPSAVAWRAGRPSCGRATCSGRRSTSPPG
jgi:class 3 adenylate cyclase